MQSGSLIRTVAPAWLLIAPMCLTSVGMPSAIAKSERPFRLTLPPQIYAVPGVEMNLYFANTILAPADHVVSFAVECSLGSSDAHRWTLTATADEVGEALLTVRATDGNGAVETASTTLKVVPHDAGAGRKIKLLIVGDSLTHASAYPNEIAALLNQPENPEWHMLGTHKPAGAAPKVAHEGYGGWTWAAFNSKFAADATKPGSSSPFVFMNPNGTPEMDLKRYFQERCNGDTPDFIVVKLGINDCFSFNFNDEKQLDSQIHGVFEEAEKLLAEFRKAVPNAEIGLCLTTPGNALDEAFVANYQDRYTRWGWRKIQHRLVERQLSSFSQRESEKIFLVPTELNLDVVDGYPVNNAVHPNAQGYQQIGRTIYTWLKWRLNETPR